jgi:hypothetical protein
VPGSSPSPGRPRQGRAWSLLWAAPSPGASSPICRRRRRRRRLLRVPRPVRLRGRSVLSPNPPKRTRISGAGWPIRALAPARAPLQIDGYARSRARRRLRLGAPRIPICFVRSMDPGLKRSPPQPESGVRHTPGAQRDPTLPAHAGTPATLSTVAPRKVLLPHGGRRIGRRLRPLPLPQLKGGTRSPWLSPNPPKHTRILGADASDPCVGSCARSTDALPRVLVAAFGSSRPASQSASSVRWIRA